MGSGFDMAYETDTQGMFIRINIHTYQRPRTVWRGVGGYYRIDFAPLDFWEVNTYIKSVKIHICIPLKKAKLTMFNSKQAY